MNRLHHLLRRHAAIALLSATALAACGGGGDDDDDGAAAETIAAVLTADQETPPVASGAFGSAELSLDRATRTLSGSIEVDGVTPTVAHIHAGEAGTAGGVVFNLDVSGTAITLPATVLTQAQLDSLDAGEFYFNVHSAAHASGEIRGQIGREVYVASLSGGQETAPVTTAANGSGRLVLDPATRALSGEIEIQGLTATAAHVHAGAFGSNGGVLVTLEDHGGHGHFTVPAGTVLTEAQVESLRNGELYFNVHSAANPGGEIRGQIGRQVALAEADGAQEVPSNASTATGRMSVVYDPATRAVSGSLQLTGMTATAAHLHMAPAGSNGPIAVNLEGQGNGVWAIPADTRLSAEQARALLAGELYVNAHSAAFPAGEVRGQLTVE